MEGFSVCSHPIESAGEKPRKSVARGPTAAHAARRQMARAWRIDRERRELREGTFAEVLFDFVQRKGRAKGMQ
jgi:hypothetical protein